MKDQLIFQPNWISRPGTTIVRLSRKKELTNTALAKCLNITNDVLAEIISGQKKICPQLASRLAMALGGTKEFWLARESQYRNTIVSRELDLVEKWGREWLKSLPVKDMQRFGWIIQKTSNSEQVRECLRYFDVSKIEIWQRTYASVMENAAFRKSPKFTSNIGSVSAWFRRAELETESIICSPWNPQLLRGYLPRIRTMTWKKNPKVFIPKLKEICSKCGIAFALVPLPKGCTASGATWFDKHSRAILVLSARYRSDDHLWFTFFHEVAHLLLHKLAGPIIEESDINPVELEEEANSFASEVLIPHEFREEFLTLKASSKEVFEFSKKVGIAPGIVVGQLQFFGRIRRNELNHLKRRFVWSVSNRIANLEMA